jgi:hypothetical protein
MPEIVWIIIMKRITNHICLQDEQLFEIISLTVSQNDHSVFLFLNEKRNLIPIKIFNGSSDDDIEFPKHPEYEVTATKKSKISFHPDGAILLENTLKRKSNKAIRRLGLSSSPHWLINSPILIMDIFLPTKDYLNVSRKKINKYDLIFNLKDMPNYPHRLTIFCMSDLWYEQNFKQDKIFYSSSEFEMKDFLSFNELTWAFIFRRSKNDNLSNLKYFTYYLNGKPNFPHNWPQVLQPFRDAKGHLINIVKKMLGHYGVKT